MQAEPRAVTPTSRATFVAVLTTVTCLRLYYCTCLPVNTGDVTRHLAWGCVINQSGYAAADRPLADKHPAAKRIVWSHLPFSYPVVSLLFDQLTAALWASIFWMKLTLTLLEALTAFLIYRYTGERALALLYWASPLSVWWCSHEGQIEPLQNALAVGSLLALHGRGFAAGGLLALATQAKLTAICLLPAFFAPKGPPERIARLVSGGLAGCLPTVLAFVAFSPWRNFRSSFPLDFNPYYFNPFDRQLFRWTPTWLRAANEVATYGMLIVLILFAVRDRDWMTYVPAILFLAVVKIATQAQPWYMMVAPVFFLPIANRRLRLTLFILAPLLDVWSLGEMILGPFGDTVGIYYYGGIGAATNICGIL